MVTRRYSRNSNRNKKDIDNISVISTKIEEEKLIKSLNFKNFKIENMLGSWYEHMRINNNIENKLTNIGFCINQENGEIHINHTGKTYVLHNIKTTFLKLKKTKQYNELLVLNKNKFNLNKIKIYYIDVDYKYCLLGDLESNILWLLIRDKITSSELNVELEKLFNQYYNNKCNVVKSTFK